MRVFDKCFDQLWATTLSRWVGNFLEFQHDVYSTCSSTAVSHSWYFDLHVGHVSGEVQKNILLILLWAPAVVGELHCLVIPERLVASQESF